jgi:nitroreductase
MSTFLNRLEWRHATKAFDGTKSVTDSDLEKILSGIRMAPSSFGLQPFHVEVIRGKVLREKLFHHAWNQVQITSCSALLVFVAHSKLSSRIDQYIEGLSAGNAQARAGLKDYEEMMKGALVNRSPEEQRTWATKQAYIALGFGLAACAELGIDSCPMEGFNSPEFDKLLDLPEGQFSSVLLPIGYADSSVLKRPKFRFPHGDLFKNK